MKESFWVSFCILYINALTYTELVVLEFFQVNISLMVMHMLLQQIFWIKKKSYLSVKVVEI